MINNKTWKKISEEHVKLVKDKILELAGTEVEAKGQYDEWKIKISDSEFTLFSSKKGLTLYSNGSKSGDSVIQGIYDYIEEIIGGSFVKSEKKYTIGLDEAGKGELVGHLFLSGVFIPTDTLGDLSNIVGTADTKSKKSFEYWDNIFKNIDNQKKKGLDFVLERIEPWVFDKYNVNKIIDVVYQRILNEFLRRVGNFSEVRIVLDDYGIGPTLQRFLKFLEMQGAEIIVAHKADDDYLEAKVASLVSKRYREVVLKAINNNEKYKINGQSIGSGNAGNPQTLKWLKDWYESEQSWPWFIKKSFKTISEIEGHNRKAKKVLPPFNEKVFSKEFIESFENGVLNIKTLSVVCPQCGETLKSIKMANYYDKDSGFYISNFKCSSCDNFIDDISFSLRYYCGYLLPDSNAVSRNVITNDLKASKNFENYKILMSSVVRKEIDGTPRAKKELDDLKVFVNKGIIKIENVGDDLDIAKLDSAVKDNAIIQHAVDYNSILITGDKSMATFALGEGLFVIDLS
jgi:ribonuclease HII